MKKLLTLFLLVPTLAIAGFAGYGMAGIFTSITNSGGYTQSGTSANTLTGTLNAVAINASGQITSTLATGTAPLVIASTTPVANLVVSSAEPLALSATSASIGGSALTAGACATTSTTVTGATVGMIVVSTPNTFPGAGNLWHSYISAANTVVTEICAIIAATPVASTYNIRVFQ